jgi:tRNA threonylcarbamoyladenosine biosynthesis protein TsaB
MYDTSEGELKRKSEYLAIDVEALAERITQAALFVGPGARLYRKELIDLLGEKAYFAVGDQSTPSGASVARIGSEKLAAGQTEAIADLEPMYIRKSEAELKFRNAARG